MFFNTLERIRNLAVKHKAKSFTPEQFTHLLRMQFRDKQLRFACQRHSELPRKDFFIKGEYRPYEDSQDEPCIFMTLVFGKNCRKIQFKNYNWDSISFHLADTITHEYLHQYYLRKRNYRDGQSYQSTSTRDTIRNYFGCEDEILAYSFNVASEMVVYNTPMEKTRVYRLYKKYFRQDNNVMLQLTKQTNKYIKRLEQQHEQANSSRGSRRR